MTTLSKHLHGHSARVTAPRLSMAAAVYAVLASLALAGLTLAARGTQYFGPDLAVAHAVQSFRAPGIIPFMRALSWPGFPPQVYGLVGVICIALFFLYSRWGAICLGLGALAESFIGLGIKILVDRPRPSPQLVNAIDLATRGASSGWGLSFPAGHPASYMVMFGFLGYLAYSSRASLFWRALGVSLCTALIVLVGISRIYLGDHWFSDVVAGYLLGSVVLVVTIFIYRWGLARFANKHDR